MTVGSLQLDQRVEGVPRRLHSHILKHHVKPADLKGYRKADNLRNTLDAEPVLRIPAGEPASIPAEDADSELILVRSSKLRNIGRNLSLFDVWASRFQCLIDQILKHNFCLLLSSMTFHSCCRTFHTLQETPVSTFSVHFLLF